MKKQKCTVEKKKDEKNSLIYSTPKIRLYESNTSIYTEKLATCLPEIGKWNHFQVDSIQEI